MIKLKNILNEITLEESLSSAKNRFLKTGLVDDQTFDTLKSLDPSPTFKYLEKIISFYLDDEQDIEELRGVISKFDNLLKKNQVKTKDINLFKNFKQLKDETDSADKSYSVKQNIKIKSNEAETVFENERFLVIIPRTHEASCKYGAGTKWCTTQKDSRMYRHYTREGVTLYYILDKTKTENDVYYKMAVAVYPTGSKKHCFNSLDKRMSFTDVIRRTGLDPKLFVSTPSELTPYMVMDLDETKITENSDGTINYDGSVELNDFKFEKFPVKFNVVTGDFICFNGRLKTLDGAPQKVGGNFGVSNNQIKTLQGGPKEVGGSYYCTKSSKFQFFSLRGELVSLEGAPEKVGKSFLCWGNKLKSLKGGPKEVGSHYNCSYNQLTSLEGAPRKVGGDFYCYKNKLSKEEIEKTKKTMVVGNFISEK